MKFINFSVDFMLATKWSDYYVLNKSTKHLKNNLNNYFFIYLFKSPYFFGRSLFLQLFTYYFKIRSVGFRLRINDRRFLN